MLHSTNFAKPVFPEEIPKVRIYSLEERRLCHLYRFIGSTAVLLLGSKT